MYQRYLSEKIEQPSAVFFGIEEQDDKIKKQIKKNNFFINFYFCISKDSTLKEKETEYIQSVIKADFEEAGDEDVFRKIKADLKNHNISDEEIRKKMDELNEKAKSEFK